MAHSGNEEERENDQVLDAARNLRTLCKTSPVLSNESNVHRLRILS